MTKKQDSIKELRDAFSWIGIFIAIPFILVYSIPIIAIFFYTDGIYSGLDTLNLQKFLEMFKSVIESEQYGGIVLTVSITIVASFFVYVTYLARMNPKRAFDDTGIEVLEYFIRAFGLFNFILPIIITLLISKPFSLSGLGLALVLGINIIVFLLLDTIKKAWKFLIVLFFNMGLVLLVPYIEIKEALIIFGLFAVSNYILKKIEATISKLTNTYEGAERFALDKAKARIDRIRPEQIFDKDKLAEIIEHIIVGLILWLARNTTWMAYSFIVVGMVIAVVSYYYSFTILLPLYFFLTIPAWVGMAANIRSLPKDEVTIQLTNKKTIKNAIIIFEDYRHGYVKVITKENMILTIFINSIQEIVRKPYKNQKKKNLLENKSAKETN